MESFTIELLSNAYAQLIPGITLGSFTNLLPEHLNLEDHWQVAISEITYSSKYQNVTERKFMFSEKKFSKSSEIFYLERDL